GVLLNNPKRLQFCQSKVPDEPIKAIWGFSFQMLKFRMIFYVRAIPQE
ncbi:unnamed protein product, partial [Allacma fusca]